MPTVLLATDAEWIRNEVEGSLLTPGTELIAVERGEDVLATVAARSPDVIVLDFQIGHMGGPAVCRELRNEEEAGRLPRRTPILVLLDRIPDEFLARRADADAWLIKPLGPGALERAVAVLSSGEQWSPSVPSAFEGERRASDEDQLGETRLEVEGSAAQGVGGDSEAVRPGSPADAS